MKKILTGLLIFLAICFITGCQQPVGIVTNSGGGAGNMDFMWLVPNRLLYETYDSFNAQNDLQILVAEDGVVKEIPYDSPSVTIEIIENPGMTSEKAAPVRGMYFPFSLPGRHIINVKYNDKSARYSIEVRGTYTGGGDGSDFLDLIWL